MITETKVTTEAIPIIIAFSISRSPHIAALEGCGIDGQVHKHKGRSFIGKGHKEFEKHLLQNNIQWCDKGNSLTFWHRSFTFNLNKTPT
jgi:hypothetical protein